MSHLFPIYVNTVERKEVKYGSNVNYLTDNCLTDARLQQCNNFCEKFMHYSAKYHCKKLCTNNKCAKEITE